MVEEEEGRERKGGGRRRKKRTKMRRKEEDEEIRRTDETELKKKKPYALPHPPARAYNERTGGRAGVRALCTTRPDRRQGNRVTHTRKKI